MPLCIKTEEKTVHRKLVVCGDGATGKTSLLSVFTRDYFPDVKERERKRENDNYAISWLFMTLPL